MIYVNVKSSFNSHFDPSLTKDERIHESQHKKAIPSELTYTNKSSNILSPLFS